MQRLEGSVYRPKGEKPETVRVECLNCGRRCKPRYETDWRRFESSGEVRSEYWYTGKILGYGVQGKFCTNVCAIRFGLRCARAGVKFEGLDTFRQRKGSDDAAA